MNAMAEEIRLLKIENERLNKELADLKGIQSPAPQQQGGPAPTSSFSKQQLLSLHVVKKIEEPHQVNFHVGSDGLLYSAGRMHLKVTFCSDR